MMGKRGGRAHGIGIGGSFGSATSGLAGALWRPALFPGATRQLCPGEAQPDSDVDVVCILDELRLEDLAAYRELLQTLPGRQMACGFVAGAAEVAAWPPTDLFTFYHDTQPLLGRLEPLLPPIPRAAVEQALHEGAANLYHALCHSYVFGEHSGGSLAQRYKEAFFLLQAQAYLREGVYYATKRALFPCLIGLERHILEGSLKREAVRAWTADEVEAGYRELLDWTGRLLRAQAGKGPMGKEERQ